MCLNRDVIYSETLEITVRRWVAESLRRGRGHGRVGSPPHVGRRRCARHGSAGLVGGRSGAGPNGLSAPVFKPSNQTPAHRPAASDAAGLDVVGRNQRCCQQARRRRVRGANTDLRPRSAGIGQRTGPDRPLGSPKMHIEVVCPQSRQPLFCKILPSKRVGRPCRRGCKRRSSGAARTLPEPGIAAPAQFKPRRCASPVGRRVWSGRTSRARSGRAMGAGPPAHSLLRTTGWSRVRNQCHPGWSHPQLETTHCFHQRQRHCLWDPRRPRSAWTPSTHAKTNAVLDLVVATLRARTGLPPP